MTPIRTSSEITFCKTTINYAFAGTASIRAANRDIPAGSITQGRREIGVRTLTAFTHPDEISSVQILTASAGEGERGRRGEPTQHPTPNTQLPLTVGDVATILDTSAVPTTLSRVNGRESIGIVITRVSDTLPPVNPGERGRREGGDGGAAHLAP